MSQHPRPQARLRGPRGRIAALALLALAILPVAPGAASGAELPTLAVNVTASSISVGTPPPAGAVNVQSTSSGAKEAATVLMRLNPGVSDEEVRAFLATNKAGKDPNTASKFGSLVFDAEDPAGKSEAQTTLAAGKYMAFNPEGPQSSKWPSTSFTIAPAATPVALPAAAAVEKTIDFNFRGPTTLHVGELVRFENEGFVVHMNLAFPVRNHKSALKLVKFLKNGSKRAEKLIAGPPVSFQGPVSTGGYQQSVITAKPGVYVQVCFMDTQDGREHVRLGMVRIIHIVK
jgi:hypothetical protein